MAKPNPVSRKAQDREDSVFGSIVLERGLVSRAELEQVLAEQAEQSRVGKPVRLGKLLESKSLLSTLEFIEVLNEQNRRVLTCPECASQFGIKSQPPGKKLRCRHCKAVLTVPTQIDTSTISGSRGGSLSATLSASSDASEEPGTQTFGKYQIKGEIARGGMGIVFRAQQYGVGRDVALKVLKREQVGSEEAMQRFYREAQLAGKLNHPNIVPIYEVGQEAGEPYFAMALISGGALDELIRERPLTKLRACELLEAVADAVGYAHGEGIIHRDLKPGNILLDDDGTPLVTDFGLAKQSEGESLTRSGVDIGTPHYMSPEQVLGQVQEIDERSDVYALGVILYQLMTRRLPFAGKSAIEIYHKILNDAPKPPSQVKRGLSRDVDAVCLKAMARDKSERYESAEAFADDLARLRAGEPVSAQPPSALAPYLELARQHQVALLAGGVALTLIALLIGLFVLPGERPSDPGTEPVVSASSESSSQVAQTSATPSSQPPGEDIELLVLEADQALIDRAYERVSELAAKALALPETPESAGHRARAFYLLGVSAYFQRKRERAELALDKAIELNPYLADAIYYRGHVRYERNKLDEARSDFARLVSLKPGSVEVPMLSNALYMRGLCNFHLGANDKAERDFVLANNKLEGRNFRALHYLGMLAFARQKNFSKAKGFFDKALEVNPNYVPSQLFRGCSYAYLGQFDKAFDDLTAAYDRDPKWVHRFIDMGLQAGQHDPQRYGVDIAEARRFIQGFSQNLKLLHQSGMITGWHYHLYTGLYHMFRKKYDESVGHFDKALAQAPFSHKRKIYIFRGQAHDYAGRHKKAIEDFSQALETNPSDVLGLLGRGVAYLKVGELEAARKDLEAVRKLNPTEPRVVMHLGLIAALQKRHREAQVLFLRVQELAPTDSRGYSLMGWLLAKAPAPFRNLKEAEKQAMIGLDRNDDVALSWGIAGFVAEARGRRAHALRLYQHAIDKVPVHWYFDQTFYERRIGR